MNQTEDRAPLRIEWREPSLPVALHRHRQPAELQTRVDVDRRTPRPIARRFPHLHVREPGPPA